MRNEPAGHHANVMTTSAGSLCLTFSPASRRLRKLLHGVLIEVYKLSQIHGEGSVFVLAEWVHAQHGFQAGHNNQPRPEAVVLGRPPRGGRLREVAPVGGVELEQSRFLPGTDRGFSVDDAMSCESLAKP